MKTNPNEAVRSLNNQSSQENSASLREILEYRNENVISRFTEKFDVSQEEAVDLFSETLKFIYLGRKSKEGIFINSDLLMIDEMWHNFILFTKDYHEFCRKYFGRYVHHTPTSYQEKQERERQKKEEPEKIKEVFLKQLKDLVSTTYDHLGEETVRKWFELYPEKYSEENIEKLQILKSKTGGS